MRVATAWGRSWRQSLGIGCLVVVGQAVQLWFAMREFWWGHWPLFSRWLWYTTIWGMVAMAVAGAWVGSRPDAQGGTYLLRTSARSGSQVWFNLARPALVAVVATQGTWFCAAWVVSRFWGFSSPDVVPIAAGTLWMASGLLLGVAVARALNPWLSMVVSGVGAFLALAACSSAPDYLPIHYLVATSLMASGAHADAAPIETFRLALLGCCAALSTAFLTRSRSLALVSFGGASIVSASLYFILPTHPVALPHALDERCSGETPVICTQQQEQAIEPVYTSTILEVVDTHPAFFQGVQVIQTFDDDLEALPSTTMYIPVMHGEIDMNAYYTTPADVRFSVARQVVRHGCGEKGEALNPLLEIRAKVSFGLDPQASARPRDPSPDSIRALADEALAASFDKIMGMSDAELESFLASRRHSSMICALTPESFLER